VHRIADYSFVRALGEGNHGEFYLATPPARLRVPAEYVAVKVLTGGGTDESFRRMTKELRAFAAVQSPYLVTLYDAGQEGGTFYYSMEYFPLGSLAAPARPLSRGEIIRAVSHAARAAHALHESGVAHRDIKPANVMLHDNGAKLSDLGLAQVLQPGQTVTGIGTIGSIEFIDPVIMRGERASRSTDIWSLGLTLHRALSGVGVYGELPDRDPLLALRKVLSSTPTLDPSLAPGEREVIEACIEPDVTRRIPTALALAERLEQLVAQTA
jgi:serine/threonine protein kinase